MNMVAKTEKKRPSTHICFKGDTLERLREYVERLYGAHRAMSAVVDRAVREFLDREGA